MKNARLKNSLASKNSLTRDFGGEGIYKVRHKENMQTTNNKAPAKLQVQTQNPRREPTVLSTTLLFCLRM